MTHFSTQSAGPSGFVSWRQGGDGECANQHPPLPAEVGRGRSSGILLGVARGPVLCGSVASDALDVRRSGVVMLDGVSGEGDWLPLEELEFL